MKPWEKYQQQAQPKPWEKYAKTQEQPKPQTEEPSFLVGLGKGFADTERGLTNLVGYDRYGDTSEADKQIKDSGVGIAGSMVGSVLSAVPTAFIPGANTVTGGALIGGATGALFNKDNRLQNAGLGFAGGGLGNALPYAANLAHKVVAPFGGTATKEKILSKLLNEVAGDNAPAIQSKLAGATELVPGSKPTAAEVAESGGISALQRYSAQANSEAYSHRAQSQAAARIEALQGIAKDEQALQAAIADRSNQTSGLYDSVHNSYIQSSPELERILSTSAGQKAVSDARQIASNEYRQFGEPIPGMYPKESELKIVHDSVSNTAKHWTQQPINYESDNILTAIRKLGGISKEMAQDTYGNRMWEDGLGYGLFRNNAGQSLDDMAARLAEHGYLPEGSGPYELVESLYKGNAGDMYSNAKNSFNYQPEQTESDALKGQLERLINAMESKNKPKIQAEAVEKSPYDIAYYGKDLHNIQRSLSAALSDQKTDNVLKHSIGNVLEDYKKTLEQKIPDLLTANQKYAELSQPINQMQVGQELLSKMRPALADYGALGRETGNRYATALNDIRGNLVKQATGGINRNLEDVMTSEQMQTLNAVGQDLARKANAQDLGREFGSGSNTFQNLAMNGIAEAAGIPSALSGALQFMKPGLNGAAKFIYSSPEQKMRQMLADALLEPQETARIMDIVNNPSVLAKLLRNKQVGALPGVMGSSIAESSQQ
jgi:hypothetical protein